MDKFEYKIITERIRMTFKADKQEEICVQTQEKLDELGDIGWELVSVVPITSRGTIHYLVSTFKRKK